ncbi:DUF29 domain-containing protein [Candidatus Competibacter phosphatis]|uniref:DUF29 domain-containing protein n=1 Tax=Candidatus Competibacter phosphatis TaxID=221280 RepID=A0ABX1TH36_9GAMM|nr:DUF29 domain-containing protein [Candidatus Competibacter phosphatis]NMQ17854.1 DUF29 domain-containing protein [Candidatus Competibacter phosphatis]
MTLADYETDFYLWTQQQAALLRQGSLSAVDAANLAEEIESMGKSDRRAVWSHLANILLHLLKWRYQPERRGSSWTDSIENGREQIDWLIKDSPSLRPKLPAFVEEVYPRARQKASRETGLPLVTFPEQCPFTVEQVTSDWWPS